MVYNFEILNNLNLKLNDLKRMQKTNIFHSMHNNNWNILTTRSKNKSSIPIYKIFNILNISYFGSLRQKYNYKEKNVRSVLKHLRYFGFNKHKTHRK